MSILTAYRRLASACAALFGPHGAVTALARRRGQSRQAVYRDTEQVLAAVAGDGPARRRATAAPAAATDGGVPPHLPRAVAIGDDQLAEFAATAQAEGISLPQVWRLLRILLGARTPCVATLGNYAAQAARQAQAVVAVLDAAARPLVEQAAADEIFCGRAALLMVVEPESFCWLGSQRVRRLQGALWAEELRRWPALRYVVSDAGSALRKGIRAVQQERRQAGQPPLRHGLDAFHTLREGRRAVRRTWRRVSAKVRAAERQQHRYERQGRQGRPRRQGPWLRRFWWAAEQAMDRAGQVERAWQQAEAALALFSPAGALQDRRQAEAAVAAALPQLGGPEWRNVVGLLRRPETFAFLDRAHEELARLPLAEATKQALVEVEGLRRRPGQLQEESVAGAVARGVALARSVQLAKGAPDWPQQAARVRQALRRAWRASSLVECLNSVARMHQCRHRRLTAGLLALKRLYWNCREFRTGRRRGQTPYGLLGLKLPTSGWWAVLQLPPEQDRKSVV